MNRSMLLLTVVAGFGLSAMASTPIATIYSPQPLTIDGHAVSAPGISSWPIVIGDEVATSTAPGTILFQDGSSIRLAAKSSARLSGTSAHPKLLLVAGNLDYKLAAGSSLELSNSQPAAPQDAGAAGQASTPATATTATTGTTATTATAATTVTNVSMAGVLAGTLVVGGIVAAIPAADAVRATSSNLPPISTP